MVFATINIVIFDATKGGVSYDSFRTVMKVRKLNTILITPGPEKKQKKKTVANTFYYVKPLIDTMWEE